ncbi:MAG: hypothetical protein DWB99_01055 [Candidatus Poseidoniales archaeon]|nr:MAG: hypothetical protein DWB99_01055 [Candidatus Poseidoniales archaeon]
MVEGGHLESDSSQFSDDNPELESLKNVETSLWKLLKTLLSPKTMPHIVMISILAVILHILASSDSLTNITSVMFISLSMGYSITAIGSKNERVRSWTIAQSENSSEVESKVVKFIKKFKICIFPLSASLVSAILILTLFGENGLIPQLYDLIPVFLGSLFVLWAIIQGVSFSTWASSLSANKTKKKGAISNLKFSTGFNGIVLMGFSIISVGIFQFLKDPNSTPLEIFFSNGIYLFLVLALYISTSAWTWKLRSLGENNQTLNSFSNRWSLICHIFLSWHLLTIWRQNFMSPNSIEIFIEELILMIFTVFMAIWSLTSKGYATKFKLLNEQNSLPWGLAFGYAYAGSVAMLTNVFDEITTVMTIGHSVVVITVVYVYRKVLTNVFSKHDDGVLMRRLAANVDVKKEISEHEETDSSEESVRIESKKDDSESNDWQEDNDVDWDKQKDDNTISSDVEWEETIELD